MPPKIQQPSIGALDDPASGQHRKTSALFFDDFQIDFVTPFQIRHPRFERFARIAAIDPQLLEPFDARRNISAHQRHQPVSITDIGGRNPHAENQTQGIDQQMTLAAVDLFAPIGTRYFSLGCRLYTLTIDTTG